MSRSRLVLHLSVPILFALGVLLLSLQREPLTGELLVSHLAWGLFFYAAPHLLWAAFSAAVRPSLLIWHAGFALSSCALLLIGALQSGGHVTHRDCPISGLSTGHSQEFSWQRYSLAGFWQVVHG